jgi:multidrug efflux pump subunit AcrA (membrane-fusion protein)
VPDSALWHQGEVTGVFVIGEHGVSLRQVRTGDHFGDRVEVISGLAGGEHIATDPTAAARYLSQVHSGAST